VVASGLALLMLRLSPIKDATGVVLKDSIDSVGDKLKLPSRPVIFPKATGELREFRGFWAKGEDGVRTNGSSSLWGDLPWTTLRERIQRQDCPGNP
jgi:hypothetical protein